MNILLKFLLRALFIAAGLIFALSLIVLMCILMVFWGVRALWCKLTGQPVNPFVMRMNPRAGFDQFYKSNSTTSHSSLARDGLRGSRHGDVVDAEVKHIDPTDR